MTSNGADPPEPVLELSGVSRVIDDNVILRDIDWAVRPGERWVVLGRNGSGKSTLLKIAAMYMHPTTGTVEVLGERLGRTDVRTLRARIGYASAGLADSLRHDLTVRDVVMTAKHAALEPWWHTYDDTDRARADALLTRVDAGSLIDRRFATLSSGERQRTLLARSLMNDPPLILLDEPTAALDLAGREQLVSTLGRLAQDPATPPTVLVTHHVEEIPPGFTHVALMAQGCIQEAGPIATTLTASSLSDCFGVEVELERRRDRYAAWASPR